MNWQAFFTFLGVALSVPVVLYLLAEAGLRLEKRIGFAAAVGCLVVVMAVLGATVFGLTR